MINEQPSYIYKFKGKVPVPILSMVDDTIGVTEAGYKSDQFNSYLNVKSADKNLQFGIDKCNTMVVSKSVVQNFLQPKLEVDTWKMNIDSNNEESETFTGKTQMKNENTHISRICAFSKWRQYAKYYSQKQQGNWNTGSDKEIGSKPRPLHT